KRRLARPRHAGDNRQRIVRDFKINVLEVMNPRPANNNGFRGHQREGPPMRLLDPYRALFTSPGHHAPSKGAGESFYYKAQALSGTILGRFAVRERLGKGGMGEVYRAEDTKLRRSVALKRITPHLRSDPVYRQRFLKEAERASCFADPHVAAIYDVLEENGEIYLIMEYVEGETLRQRLHDTFTFEQFLDI